jgi:hypothetical protein
VKKGYVVGVLLVLLVTLATGAAAQSGVVTTTATLQASDSVFDQCTGEVVDFSGSLQLVTDVWMDESGATHIRNKAPVVNVKGVGKTTGNDYIVQSGGGFVENTGKDQLPLELTYIIRFSLIGTGPAPNELTLMVFHQTVNPDGTTTSEVNQIIGKCAGK